MQTWVLLHGLHNLPFRFKPDMVTWALCWERSKSLFHCTDVFTVAEYLHLRTLNGNAP